MLPRRLQHLAVPSSRHPRAPQGAVDAEKTRLLYGNASIGAVVSIVNGLIVAAVLWQSLPRALILTWFVINAVLALVRLPMVWKYRQGSPGESRARRWRRVYTLGAVFSGLTWGVLAVMAARYSSLPYQVFVAFVVGGMAIGAIAVNGSFLPAYVGFMLPAVLPIAGGFLLQAEVLTVAMGALTLVFAAALYLLGRNVNGSITRAIELSLEKQALADILQAEHGQTVESNRRLAQEAEAHRRTASELREREGVYRAMFEVNAAVKLLIDPETGAVVDANSAASRFYGHPVSSLRQKKITDINLLPPAQVFERMTEAKTGHQRRFEFQHRLASGEVRDVEVYSGPIELHGRVLVLSIIHDITERKRAEAALRGAHELLERKIKERTNELIYANDRLRQEIHERQSAEVQLRKSVELFQATFEQAAVGIGRLGAEGQWLEVNQKLCDILGYSREELRGLDLEHITHPEDRVASLEHFHRALAGEVDSYSLEQLDLRKAGPAVWTCLTVSTVHSAKDEPRNFIAIVQDISDRKRAEELLFQEKERAEITLHCIADGVITTTAAGTVDYLNPVAEALTEWPAEIARGQPLEAIFAVVDEQTRHPVGNPVNDCLKNQRITSLAEGSLLISRSGKEYAIGDSAAPIRTRDGDIVGAVLVFHDVTQMRRAKHQLVHEATHDALTGLVNRTEFERRLEHALASAKAHGGHHALCYLDLDNFKVVNDSVGHGAGDTLLKEVTALMMGKIRGRDTLARLGGDEFSLLMENCPLDNALRVAEDLLSAVKDFRFVWEDRRFAIGVSIGLVPITADAQSTAGLLTQADIACYTAKDLGRGRVHIYHPRGGESLRKRWEFSRIAHLRQALQRDELLLYQQPIVALAATGSGPVLRELLLRLVDTEEHLLLPRAFLPIAERYGLMASVDRWVIQNAFRYWGAQLAASPDLGITINLSASSLSDQSMPAFVRSQFSESRLLPNQVCFEIAENSVIHNLDKAIEFMRDLKSNGCTLALDQFGNGPSSFYHLKRLPVDYLKIRGRLVRDMAADNVNRSIVEAINDVGHALGMLTIAESVETDEVLKALQAIGVDYAQGIALGPPSAPQDPQLKVIH